MLESQNLDRGFRKTHFGTSNGLTLAKIETSQPAVIPAAYQDGKFADIGGTTLSGSLTRKYGASATDFTSVSASGYYNFHGLKVGMATGSGNYQFVDGTTTTINQTRVATAITTRRIKITITTTMITTIKITITTTIETTITTVTTSRAT